MFNKKVIYNGGTTCPYQCEDPSKLIPGKEYEIVAVVKLWNADFYCLSGQFGYFCSGWFDDQPSAKIFIAFSEEKPIVGQRYECIKVVFSHGKLTSVPQRTSIVVNFHEIGFNIYEVTTQNSIYIVLVK